MKGLKRLRIDMVLYNRNIHSRWVDPNWELLLFSSLEVIQGVKEFEVFTSWGGEDQPIRLDLVKEWPFTVRRGVMDLA